MRAIDDLAFAGSRNLACVPSEMLLRLRQTLADTHVECAGKSSWTAIGATSRRICSCEPVAYPIGRQVVNEPTRHIRVRVRGRMTWSVGATEPEDSPCVYLFATVANATGVIRLPPAYLTDWTLVNTSGGARLTVELLCDTQGLIGPLMVLLWIRSVPGEIEELVDPLAVGTQAGGGMVVASLSAEMGTSNPPERSVDVMLYPAEGANNRDADGPRRQIGWVDYDDNVLWTVPPVSTLDSAAFDAAIVEIRSMGVFDIDTVAFEDEPTALPGVSSLYFNGKPLTEIAHVAPLIGTVRRLIDKRTNQLGIAPAQVLTAQPGLVDYARCCQMFTNFAGDHEPAIGVDWVSIASFTAYSQHEVSDRAGWRGFAALAIMGNVDSIRPVDLFCRLSAYELDGTLIYEGADESKFLTRALPHAEYGAAALWYPMSQSIHRIKTFVDWQYRSALIGMVGAWRSLVGAASWNDYGALQFIQAQIPEPEEMGYPARIQIEVKLSEEIQYDILCVDAVVAARQLT